MKFLVTGASGFVGHNILLRVPRDWEVFAVYHETPIEGFVERHGLTHVHPVHCDLTSVADVASLVRKTGSIDACLYMAANGDPAKSAERPAWDLQLNTYSLVTLLEQLTVGHVVFISSGAVYDGLKGPVTTITPLAPRLPYAIAKLASEHYLRTFAERTPHVRSYLNVRFFGAYGPYEPDRKITTRWMRGVMGGQRVFTIRGNGENLIDFMYVDDAVDGLLKLCTAEGFSGTVDFASRAPITINQVVETMARILGVEVSIKHEGHVAEYIEFLSTDTTLLDRFGIKPAIPLDAGLRRLHEFLLQEVNGTQQPARA